MSVNDTTKLTSRKSKSSSKQSKNDALMPSNESFTDIDDDEDEAEGEEGKDYNVSVTKVEVKKPFVLKNFIIRTMTTFTLLGFFYTLVNMGHLYCILFITVIQTEIYRELVNVRYVAAKQRNIPWFRSIQWGWFVVPMFYCYGEQLNKFCSEHRQLAHVASMTQHISQISFILYCFLFVSSVATLRQGSIKYQLSHYMWSIVTVCMVVFQMKFFGENTLNGLFWFIFPSATVIFNDIFAYVCGVFFGKKFFNFPLTQMSPNKTWEGFIGSAILTIIFSYYFSDYLSNSQWIICPADSLYLVPFPPPLSCDPNPVFLDTLVVLPIIGMKRYMKPIRLHGLAYGVFASLLAPFGGFYASAIKRAYKIKDFDSLFPGHGGVMDRFDCQLFMVGFTAFHYYSQIAPIQTPSVDQMMSKFVSMRSSDQLAFIQEVRLRSLYTLIQSDGVIDMFMDVYPHIPSLK